MAFQDKTLKCKDCGCDFIFTVGEQDFYAEKGFENEPVRCREMHEAVCAQCGITTQVPFKPRNDRPIYCRECFKRA